MRLWRSGTDRNSLVRPARHHDVDTTGLGSGGHFGPGDVDLNQLPLALEPADMMRLQLHASPPPDSRFAG